MEGVVVITAVTALAGIVMVVLALSKLRRGHLITSGGNGLIGLTLLIIGGTLTALGLTSIPIRALPVNAMSQSSASSSLRRSTFV